jgi:tRNA-specific 2-thiouridylase
MKTNPKTVLVGMSGGVDSSVSAALLLEQGYTVVGGFIKNWSDSKDLWTGECQWRGERRDAMRVAAKLGIPLLTFDFEESYRKAVVDELFRGYEAGETPNPDVLCNEFIKFGLFADEAKRLGFDFIATGHYARVQRAESGSGAGIFQARTVEHVHNANPQQENACTGSATPARLMRGLDPDKDQSYFLYRISHDVLQRTLFPIGELKKSEVREIAERFELPVAQKPDSQGICFIGKIDMAEFLRKKIPSKPGDIVDETGEVLGHHEGLDSYTVGQRHGILKSDTQPYYVAKKDATKNQLVVVKGSEHPMLFQNHATLRDLHWTRGEAPQTPLACDVQVRYRQEPVKAKYTNISPPYEGGVEGVLDFASPVKAVAPGQSAVIYVGDECLGGGIIVE